MSERNTALLLSLSDSLRKGINLNDEEQRNLYAFADSYLQDAIDSANNERIREEALKKVLILTSDIIQSNELTSNKVDQLVDSEMIIRQRLAQTDNAVNSLRDSLNSQSEWFAKENAMHQNELDRLGASLTELSKEFVEANTSLQSIQVELMSQSERLTKENKILKYFIGASMCLSILAFALAFAFLQQ